MPPSPDHPPSSHWHFNFGNLGSHQYQKHTNVTQGDGGTAAIGNSLQGALAHFGPPEATRVEPAVDQTSPNRPAASEHKQIEPSVTESRPIASRVASTPASLDTSRPLISPPRNPLSRVKSDPCIGPELLLRSENPDHGLDLDEQAVAKSTVSRMSSRSMMSNAGSTADEVHSDNVSSILFEGVEPNTWGWTTEPLGGSFFVAGRVIRLDDEVNNGALRRRTMVVVAVSSDGMPQCLSLCVHKNHDGEEEGTHWDSHSATHSEEATETYTRHKNPVIYLDLKNKKITRVAPRAFINYEHTWTLASNSGNGYLRFQNLGSVVKRQRKEFLETYLRVKRAMVTKELRKLEADAGEGGNNGGEMSGSRW